MKKSILALGGAMIVVAGLVTATEPMMGRDITPKKMNQSEPATEKANDATRRPMQLPPGPKSLREALGTSLDEWNRAMPMQGL